MNSSGDHAIEPKDVSQLARRSSFVFNIPEPSTIRGSNILIEANHEAARKICELIETTAADNAALFAFAKGIRRYYGKMTENNRDRQRRPDFAGAENSLVGST